MRLTRLKFSPGAARGAGPPRDRQGEEGSGVGRAHMEGVSVRESNVRGEWGRVGGSRCSADRRGGMVVRKLGRTVQETCTILLVQLHLDGRSDCGRSWAIVG